MKLTNRRFMKLIRQGWDELLPPAGEYKPMPCTHQKRGTDWLNICAILIMCILSSIFLINPGPEREVSYEIIHGLFTSIKTNMES